MGAPSFYDRIIEPPQPSMSSREQFTWLYDVWKRTGGFNSVIPDLTGLLASVQELNTLVGIDTDTTVQAQLDSKVNLTDIGTMAAQDADNVNILGGNIGGNTNIFGNIEVTIGTSSSTAIPGASINTNVNAVGNIGVGEDNLMTYTLLANMLGNTGDYLDIDAYGTFAANANNKQIRLYFGSTVIFNTGAIAANAGSWWIKAQVSREALADQQAISSIISSNALITPTSSFTDPSESLNAPVIIKVTGEATANNDIIQEGLSVKWFAAA